MDGTSSALRFDRSQLRAGQALAMKHHLRPCSPKLLASNPVAFPKLEPFTVEELFGSWKQA